MATDPGQATDHGEKGRLSFGWIVGWASLLALAAWLSQLSTFWVAVLALGNLIWTASLARRPDALALCASGALWLTVGVACGVQYRLTEVVEGWPELQLRIEERSADALGEALDDLVESGERAVAGAEGAADLIEAESTSPELFSRLASLQRSTGVSALALYGADGAPIAWAGEHRGSVPHAARYGEQSYLFSEGPLFSYLYFVRPVADGTIAIASFLLEAEVDIGKGGTLPFAERFERRYGTRPRFWVPERARAASVWDWATDRPILSVSFAELTQQRRWEQIVRNGRRAAAIGGLAALLLLSAGWYRARMLMSGVPVLVGTSALLIAPLGPITGAELLFSPLQFVLPGPLDVTLGVLLITLLGAAVWLLTRAERGRGRRMPPWLTGLTSALVFPAGLALTYRSAAEGLLAAKPAGGFFVQLSTSLLIAVPLLVLIRHSQLPQLRSQEIRWTRVVGFALPAVFGIAMLLWWRPGHPVPLALAALWAIPTILLTLTVAAVERHRSLWRWLIVGWLAGTAALTFLWPLHVRADLARAEREIALLGAEADPFLDFLLRQFAERAMALSAEGESGVNLLYHSWVASGLAREGYEARITYWEETEPRSELNLSGLDTIPPDAARQVASTDEVMVRHYGGENHLQYLLVAPLDDNRTVSVAIPPRRRVGWATPLARFLHPQQDAAAAFRGETLYLVPVQEGQAADHALVPARSDTVHWVRTPEGWRSETLVEMPEGPVHAHMIVATPGSALIMVRAILVQTAILISFFALWFLAKVICRELATVPYLQTGWLRSFRGRLSVALFFFFLLPTVVFGAVSYSAVAREVVHSAAALAQQALDQAAARIPISSLAEAGGAARSDLLLYRGGSLLAATAPELLDLGLFHTWLSPDLYLRFAGGESLQELEDQRLAENDYLVAYRRLDPASVLGAPIPLASHEITRRQREFRDITLLMILMGLGFSVFLSLLVGRALSRPLDELTRAAGTVGAGNLRTPLPRDRGDEFGSVYASFNRMVRRLRRTRAALVSETRRTETIVAEAATGVLALDSSGRVELVNARAMEILDIQLRRGDHLTGGRRPEGALTGAIEQMWSSERSAADAEVEENGRIVRMKLRRLSGEGEGGGAVIALEDVTAEVRTARVLAWGEMARQVAHEIKNPLTPIKLSVQHLKRAFDDGRPDFAEILDRNVSSVLSEIDRLGEIARAFSRFGTPAAVAAPLQAVELPDAIREVLTLYRSSSDGPDFRAELPAEGLPPALARPGELKEVLLNLLENAREAVDGGGEIIVKANWPEGDDWLSVSISDTGIGIAPDQLPHIFEPHFSTRSSGTGLGLAIVRRIVESWGGEILAESELGSGSRFEIRLRSAPGRPNDRWREEGLSSSDSES